MQASYLGVPRPPDPNKFRGCDVVVLLVVLPVVRLDVLAGAAPSGVAALVLLKGLLCSVPFSAGFISPPVVYKRSFVCANVRRAFWDFL